MKTLIASLVLMSGVSVFANNSLDPFAAVRQKPTFKNDIYVCQDSVIKRLVTEGKWNVTSWNDQNLLLSGTPARGNDGITKVKIILVPTILNDEMNNNGVGYVYGEVSFDLRRKMMRFDNLSGYGCNYVQMNYYNIPRTWERPAPGDIFDKLMAQSK